MPSNYFHTRERLGALGGIVQHHTALYRSVAVYEPAVLIVRRGSKKLRWAGRELRIAAGKAVALAGGQTFDVINIPDSDGLYQAQWIAFEQEAIERFAAQYGTAQAVCDAVKLPHPGGWARRLIMRLRYWRMKKCRTMRRRPRFAACWRGCSMTASVLPCTKAST